MSFLFFTGKRPAGRQKIAGQQKARREADEEEDMEKKEQLYEGKAKKVYSTDEQELLIVEYKDDATAFNG